jgi:hypothetical protein
MREIASLLGAGVANGGVVRSFDNFTPARGKMVP